MLIVRRDLVLSMTSAITTTDMHRSDDGVDCQMGPVIDDYDGEHEDDLRGRRARTRPPVPVTVSRDQSPITTHAVSYCTNPSQSLSRNVRRPMARETRAMTVCRGILCKHSRRGQQPDVGGAQTRTNQTSPLAQIPTPPATIG